MGTNEQLVELLRFSHAEIHRFADSLDPSERDRVGQVDHWSAHDVLAHLAEDQKHLADRLAGMHTSRQEKEPQDFDEINAAIWEKYRQRSLDEILEVLDTAQDELRLLLASMEEEALNEKGIVWLEGRPLWRYVAGLGFLHPNAHLRALYIERGDFETAKFLCKEEARLAGGLTGSPDWISVVTYNAGCNYALMGEKALAIETLSSSLRSHPSLIEWSEQDTDLDSLRGEPEFTALMAELKKMQ